jgi:glycerol-3-phosphate acyltransferase PlsX
MIKVAIDAMGGDFGAKPIVEGVVEALKLRDFLPILIGDETLIKEHLPSSLSDKVKIVHTKDFIAMSDSATDALKRKDSSIYKAIELVRKKEADAVVSAGHSGSTMSVSTLRIGRIKGIIRPALATTMPTYLPNKKTFMLDVGANVDCKAEHLEQFAIMGEIYAKDVLGVKNPKVGLLANGEEKSKGNEVTKEAFSLLAHRDRFIGNVEGSDIFNGSVDVVVCDGFEGNLALKTAEGTADAVGKIIKNNIKGSFLRTIGGLLLKPAFEALKKKMDYAEYGGAPLLGVKECTIIAHGKSNAKAIKNAIFQALDYVKSDAGKDIQDGILNTQREK